MLPVVRFVGGGALSETTQILADAGRSVKRWRARKNGRGAAGGHSGAS